MLLDFATDTNKKQNRLRKTIETTLAKVKTAAGCCG